MATALQTQMLVRIAEDELTCLNGAVPDCVENASTFADCVIEDAQDKGVFTSCLNANLVWHAGKGRDAVVGLTDEGFAVYQEYKKNS